ncbi:uncharacterized protein [Watersipora subatra]|uniref:uncharacterized protein n=1 Tax=Watersipora subatra TaxID=2589382 RepID=UPI00355B8AE1
MLVKQGSHVPKLHQTVSAESIHENSSTTESDSLATNDNISTQSSIIATGLTSFSPALPLSAASSSLTSSHPNLSATTSSMPNNSSSSNHVNVQVASSESFMTLGVDSGPAPLQTMRSVGRQMVSTQLQVIPERSLGSTMSQQVTTLPQQMSNAELSQASNDVNRSMSIMTSSIVRPQSSFLSSTPLIGTGNISPSSTERTLNLSVTAAYNQGTRLPGQYISTSTLPTHRGYSNNNGNTPVGSNRDSRFKRAALPTFNGDRRTWPEFRAVWLSYAHSECISEEERAWNLKQCLKGEALTHIKAILANQPMAHERMWKRLEDLYSDASAAVKFAFADLDKLKPLSDGDTRGLIEFVNTVELCYSHLGEVQQLSAVTGAQIDTLKGKLPSVIRRDWLRIYRSMTVQQRIHPFTSFMQFLEEERDMCVREVSELNSNRQWQEKTERRVATKTHAASAEKAPNSNYSPCLIHTHAQTKHTTMECNKFKKMLRKDMIALLSKHKSCFKCGKGHRRQDCPDQTPCDRCGRTDHHSLLCRGAAQNPKPEGKSSSQPVQPLKDERSTSHARQGSSYSIFPIQEVHVAGSSQQAMIFFDGGSNATYVSKDAVKRLKAKKVGTTHLEITRVGNVVTEHHTNCYRLNLLNSKGEVVSIVAYCMDEITSPVSSLNFETLKSLFPHRKDLSALVREGGIVDILLGNDYFGHHPKVEIDKAGSHLSLMEGTFGNCLQGSHPLLQQLPVVSNLIGSSCVEGDLPIQQSAQTCLTRAEMNTVEKFIHCEEMVTEIQPRCGSCKCGKCPIRGHTYSFREQQEVEIIRSNLSYDPKLEAWVTKYPWLIDPKLLPDNYRAVFATLRSTEKSLLKRGEQWKQIYCEQIQDMLDRCVARKLSDKELEEWNGPVFYISHLAVENPKSMSTPVRIVFNSSQTFEGQSLNEALAKGPDNYISSLLGILIRWREGKSVLIGDVRKMFNSIHIGITEQHCHRFLWRNMDATKKPDTYAITRVNMGDRPAPAISTEAILKTAEMMKEKFPRVATLLNESMYVDDIVESVSDDSEAHQLADDATTVLKKGGFQIKGWTFNGKGEDKSMQVLGVLWNGCSDTISFKPKLNFSKKVRGQHTAPDLDINEVSQAIPHILTKRLVLEQVMRLYDPLGILSPFIVTGKMYLRDTWDLGIGWDEPLPDQLRSKWRAFFTHMCELNTLEYGRCLTPEGAQGSPTLVIFSDASDKAYGFVAYIRWRLRDESYFCRFVLAKSRIAPIRKLSTPQLELNGAVLAKRGREIIGKEMRIKFDKVVHLTDSETVLCMLKKKSTRFKLYEGVRIGEIQAASKDMSEWRWIKGEDNPADWVTSGRRPQELGPVTSWWRGPDFLYKDEVEWGTRTIHEVGQPQEPLPGEKKVVHTHQTKATQNHQLSIDYSRCKTNKRLVWVFARLLAIKDGRSFKAGRICNITVKHLEESKTLIIKDVQATMKADLEQAVRGRYARLKPVINKDGIWVIGEQMGDNNPLQQGSDDPPLKLLPTNHPYTRLLMDEAHTEGGHRGRDATLARFRHAYWTPQGTKLAKSVKTNCRLCKIRDPQLLTQEMGKLPKGRLTPALPFSQIVLDLFGPFPVRGEVQKRTTGKAWGVIFTDLASRAVHIEAVFGYDTSSFILALRRFTNIRGWPSVIYSDPGSQLTHAEKELRMLWNSLDHKMIYKASADHGLQWVFGAADSPWYQGAAESLIRSAKRCFAFSTGGQRLSPAEFLTLCTEAANIMNERPLGRIPSEDSTINLLTPNYLLLGRAHSNSVGDAAMTVDSIKTCAEIVNSTCNKFWKRWVELYAPTMAYQSKWYKKTRNLMIGDIVMVKDSNALRSQYHLAEVCQTHPDSNDTVRRVSIRYKNFRSGKMTKTYSGSPDTVITRSVHKLALIIPVEENSCLAALSAQDTETCENYPSTVGNQANMASCTKVYAEQVWDCCNWSSTSMNNQTPIFQDCQDALDKGEKKSGAVYVLRPDPSWRLVRAICQFDDDSGWTVIQKRLDGSVDFYRGWSDYVDGFGYLDREYWMGSPILNIC